MLAQFDDQGGARVLTEVVFDLASNIKGGGTETGSGIPTVVHAHLSTDVSLAGAALAATEPAIDFTFANSRGASYTLFDLYSGGTISGSYSSIVMPGGFEGTLDTTGQDVILNVVPPDQGTLIVVH